MPKKILILNGSPHLHGNTSLLCKAFKDGAEQAGNKVSQFNLCQMKIAGCIGCMKGGKDPLSPCVIKDDMDSIYPVYEKADLVVLASPMYYWNFSGQLKCAFDRLFAVAECNPEYLNPVKEVILIMPAESDAPENWNPIKKYYESLVNQLKWHNKGMILAGGLLKSGDVANRPVTLEAFNLGASLS